MKKLFITIFSFIWIVSAVSADSNNKIQAESAWTNQSGSTLYIDSVEPNGKLTGIYINRASGYQCQNIPYLVTGWIYGTAITFTTKWKNSVESCNSITAWTGFFYRGQIQTLWQLVKNGSTSTGQIIKGSDIFKPAAMKNNKSLVNEE